MGNLAGDHVNFVGKGYGDDHVRVLSTSPFQYVGLGREPDHAVDIQIVVDAFDQFRRLIDHGHVIMFTR